MDPKFLLQPRNDTIADLVDKCARGELDYSGPDSLCAKVSAMGFKVTSLYEMVRAHKANLRVRSETPVDCSASPQPSANETGQD